VDGRSGGWLPPPAVAAISGELGQWLGVAQTARAAARYALARF